VAHTLADTLITPLNDSFVDFDLLARVDGLTGKIKGPSIYSEMVWSARQMRAQAGPRSTGSCPQPAWRQQMHNKKKVGDALEELSRRIGFRVLNGFSERVIFRELFPRGLTLLDLKDTGVRSVEPVEHRCPAGIARSDVRALRLPSLTVGF
jgi:chromosome partitioning protein